MSLRKFLFVNFTFLFLSFSTALFANSGSAGLQVMLDPNLKIERQDLTISLDQISVSYLIYNSSNSDLVQTIAVPIPMTIKVNNQNLTLQNAQAAVSYQGQDITATLKSLGVPLDPITAIHSIDSSPNRDHIRSKLIADRLLEKDQETPQWHLRTMYFWRQVFPANSKVTINESYKPLPTNKTIKGGNSSIVTMPLHALKKIYNLAVHWTLHDPITASNLKTLLETNNPQAAIICPDLKDYQSLAPQEHSFTNKTILDTKQVCFQYLFNNSYSAPIKRFTLKIDNSDNMQPLICWHAAMKPQGKNTLVFEAENYVPLQNVSVLYIDN